MTEHRDIEDAWSAGSFSGLQARQRRDIAGSSSSDRLAWLEAALVLAQASGALSRSRLVKQAACQELWYGAQASE